MNSITLAHPYPDAVEAFAEELAKLDSATAHAVAAEARELARVALLRQELRKARETGGTLSDDEVFDQLLAEADADIEASGR